MAYKVKVHATNTGTNKMKLFKRMLEKLEMGRIDGGMDAVNNPDRYKRPKRSRVKLISGLT